MKTKIKYLITGALGSGILTVSIATPIIILNNKNKKVNEVYKKDEVISKISEILKNKSVKEKTIILPSDASGKIVANNQDKIVAKVKTLIGETNLKETTTKILMSTDAPILTTPQNIIVSITKSDDNTIGTRSIFQVKREFSSAELANKDIESIKKVLDSKSDNDLIITLPSDSTGNIISKATNKNAIEKQLRKLIDPLNDDGSSDHASLKGTTIEVSMDVDAPISTTAQDVIVSITKSGGKVLRTTKTFQVKRDFTADEDIGAIKTILETKSTYHDGVLFITLPSDSSGSIIDKLENKNMFERKARKWIDPLNTDGDSNHQSLRGITITLTEVIGSTVGFITDVIEQNKVKQVTIEISKEGGTTLEFKKFWVTKHPF